MKSIWLNKKKIKKSRNKKKINCDFLFYYYEITQFLINQKFAYSFVNYVVL